MENTDAADCEIGRFFFFSRSCHDREFVKNALKNMPCLGDGIIIANFVSTNSI